MTNSAQPLKRYISTSSHGGMCEVRGDDPSNTFVRWEDVSALQADNARLSEQLRVAREELSLIAIVDQGCGGNLSFREMADSAMTQARAALAKLEDTSHE